jgi:hypothetical protein
MGPNTMGLREVELPAIGLFLVQASDGMAVASVDLDGAAAQSGQVQLLPLARPRAKQLGKLYGRSAMPHASENGAPPRPPRRWPSGILSSPSTTLASTTRSHRRFNASAPRCVRRVRVCAQAV